MTDPPFESDLAEVLSTAGSAHHEYEQTALKGAHDGQWAGFYAAFVLGRLGDFTAASRLAALLEEVDAPSNWPEAAAKHVTTTLSAQLDAMAPTVPRPVRLSQVRQQQRFGDRGPFQHDKVQALVDAVRLRCWILHAGDQDRRLRECGGEFGDERD
jgi:hypothetical protein